MKKGLGKLANLRKFSGQVSSEEWMKTELLQNLKAIEDAFNSITSLSCFSVSLSKDQNVLTTFPQTVLWDSYNGEQPLRLNVATGEIKADLAGWYFLDASMILNSTGLNELYTVSILVNNVLVKARSSASPSVVAHVGASRRIRLKKDDLVRVTVTSTIDSNYNINVDPAATYFEGHWLGY